MKLKYLSIVLAAYVFQSAATAATQTEKDWFIRIIAESPVENIEDRSNVLGQSQNSHAQKDTHDLPEKAPFGDTYLSVVFPKNDWGTESGDYNSDFRALTEEQPSWEFSVKSDDPRRDVKLSWEGEQKLDQMVVIDKATGQHFYPVIGGQAQSYSFNMDGSSERQFEMGFQD